MSNMVRRILEGKRFTQIINQQMEILKEEMDTLKIGVDEFFNRVQTEVNVWLSGGHVNQTTWSEMTNKIQQHITSLIAKSVELSGPASNENNDLQTSSTGESTEKSLNIFTQSSSKTGPTYCCVEDVDKPDISDGENSSQNVILRIASLEEAVFSLKTATEKIQKDQENVNMIFKDFSSQLENVNREIRMLSDSSSKTEQLMKDKIVEADKIKLMNSLNIDTLKESLKNKNQG